MTYIVTTYNQASEDTGHEFNTLDQAVEFFTQAMGDACDIQTAEPTMYHPSGDGREWVNYLGWDTSDLDADEFDAMDSYIHAMQAPKSGANKQCNSQVIDLPMHKLNPEDYAGTPKRK